MSVRRNNRGKWAVDITYQHPDGRIQRVVKTSPVPTRRGAEEYERQIRAQLLAGTFRTQKEVQEQTAAEMPTLSTFVEKRWLPTYPAAAGNRPCTVSEKRWALTHHIIPELGSLHLDKINAERIERLAAALRGKKLSPKSVKNILSVLRRVLASAVEWGVLPALPRLPKVKVPERDFDFYTRDESESLVQALKSDEDRALLLFALHTGARAGEQTALEWGDIDFDRGEVAFRRNRPSTLKETGPTKSGRVRRVPLTAKLSAALKRVKHLRGPLVFCRPDGRHLEIWDLHLVLDSAAHRSGLRRLRWHDLRHSFGSNAVASGVPLNVVQAWMGHSTIGMTMRYAHLAPSASTEWIRALETPQRKPDANMAGMGV